MSDEPKNPKPNGDIDKLYEIVSRHSEDIARVTTSVESNSESNRQSIKNLNGRIDDLVNAIRAQRPQLGVIAAVFISAAGLIVALASFALKSAVQPLQIDQLTTKVLNNERKEGTDRRLSAIEAMLQTQTSDQDDAQNARIDYVQTVIEDFHRLLLEQYVSGSVSGAAHASQSNTP